MELSVRNLPAFHSEWSCLLTLLCPVDLEFAVCRIRTLIVFRLCFGPVLLEWLQNLNVGDAGPSCAAGNTSALLWWTFLPVTLFTAGAPPVAVYGAYKHRCFDCISITMLLPLSSTFIFGHINYCVFLSVSEWIYYRPLGQSMGILVCCCSLLSSILFS